MPKPRPAPMPIKQYCGGCGTKLLYKPTGRFNEYTGRPLEEPFCPSGKCCEYEHDFEVIIQEDEIILKCKKCDFKKYNELVLPMAKCEVFDPELENRIL